jgi:rare lipoprotein A
VEVKIIDRGPFKEGRVLDLSEGAARRLGMIVDGEVPVEAVVLRCGD